MDKGLLISITVPVVVFGIIMIFYINAISNPSPIKEVEIGLLFSTTGDFSTYGNENILSAKMAIKDFNKFLESKAEDWRFNGLDVDLQSRTDLALEFTKEFYEYDTRILIGPQTSAELELIKPFVDENQILVISPTATAPSLAIPGDRIFRTIPDDISQSEKIVGLLKGLEINNVILLTRDDVWGNDLAFAIEEKFQNKVIDGEVIRINYKQSDSDYFSSINKVSDYISSSTMTMANIGIVIIGFDETLGLLKEANKHPNLYDVKWFGIHTDVNEKKIIKDPESSAFANKVEFTTIQFGAADNELRKDVESRLESILGYTPSNYVYSTYDAVWVIGLSILESNSTNPQNIAKILPDIVNKYEGTLGEIHLNDAGDLESNNYDIWQIVDDQWQKQVSDQFVQQPKT